MTDPTADVDNPLNDLRFCHLVIGVARWRSTEVCSAWTWYSTS
jgi:hypothetical protein